MDTCRTMAGDDIREGCNDMNLCSCAYFHKHCYIIVCTMHNLTRFNKIAIKGKPQMAADKEAMILSRVHSYHFRCNSHNLGIHSVMKPDCDTKQCRMSRLRKVHLDSEAFGCRYHGQGVVPGQN